MMPAKFIVKKTIQVDTHEFELEIYPRLVSWEVFPANHEAALYAFSNKEELNKILLNPDYAESLGVKVYVEVKDNGEKYAVLNNGEEEIELKIKQK